MLDQVQEEEMLQVQEENNALLLIVDQYAFEEGEDGEIEEVVPEIIDLDEELFLNALDLIQIDYPNDEGEEEGEVEEIEGDANVEELGEEEEAAEDDDFEEPDVAAEGEEEEKEGEEEEESEGEDETLEFKGGSPFRFREGGEEDVPKTVLVVVSNVNKRDDGENQTKEPTSMDLIGMQYNDGDKEVEEEEKRKPEAVIKNSLDILVDLHDSEEEDEDEPMEVPSPEKEGEKEMEIDMVAKRSSPSSM